MHLSYLDSVPGSAVLLLVNDDRWRIELYILGNNLDAKDAETFSLVALSGREQSSPGRIKTQGPYQCREEAKAARSAIAASLLQAGFRIEGKAPPQWRIDAQRTIRELRDCHRRYSTDCSFDPDDVFFD